MLRLNNSWDPFSNSATLSSIAYDNLHRLTSLTRPGPATTAFGYNAVGNVTSNGEEGGSTYTYNSNGLLAHAVKQVGTKKYGYDLCGNMVFRNGQSLAYDAENHLGSVTQNGATVATFGYSDDGERLWKQSANTLYVWIGNLFEARGTTNLYYIYAGPRRVCVYSPALKLPGASGNSDYNYYHPDHLGSSSVMTDATGAQVENYTYTAYGRERANGAATPDATHRFTGQVFDQDTGLYYYGARYYDSELARFVQADTVIPSLWNPQSYNRYSYALNNPLRYTDPDGHDPLDYLGGGFAQLRGRRNLDLWAKGLGRGFNSFGAAQAYIKAQHDPTGLNSDVALRQAQGEGVAAGAIVASGLADAYVTALPDLATAGLASAPVVINKVGRATENEVVTTGAVNLEKAAGRPGRLGNKGTQEHIKGIAGKLKDHGWEINCGGGKKGEEYIPGPGGARTGSSYPDITATKGDKTLRVNTIDTRANGVTPTTREADNAARIRSQKP